MSLAISPDPQNSNGIRCERTARQNADTLAVGVAWLIMDGFLGGRTSSFEVLLGGVASLIADICVLNLFDDVTLGSLSSSREGVSRI